MFRNTKCRAIASVAFIGLNALAAVAAQVVAAGPNTQVTFGHAYGSLEFDNPLVGTETVDGLDVLEWRDAGFPASGNWEDWLVNDPVNIDGYVNEIWLRAAGDAATTSTTVPSSIVSIHLHGDDNDGITDILVDGLLVATLDMYTTGTDNALVRVCGLPYAPHTIQVIDAGPSQQPGASIFDDDVALMGAAALHCFADIDHDCTRGFGDLLAIIGMWGDCPPVGPCPADLDESGDVSFADVLQLIANWGPC